MIKSFKNLLGLSLLAFFGVWMGCSSDSSPVSPSNKAVTDDGTATSTATFTVSPDVVFGDTKLRDAVMLALDIHAPLVPTEADMDSLRVLKAVGKGITNLRGLQHAENLDTLILAVNNIEDVTPLAGLENLKWLDLSKNRIARGSVGVSSLAGLINLESLNLYTQGGGFDISSLKTLTKLKRFGIGDGEFGNKVNDLVVKMPDLTWLKVPGTNIRNLDFLEELPDLEWLNISANGQLSDFKPLACLEKLKTLHLRRMSTLAWSTTADGFLLSSDDHIQYLINIGVTIHWRYT